MASSVLESMWSLMQTEDIVMVSDSSAYLCALCTKVMVNAFILASCGCQCCKTCLDTYLDTGHKYCSGSHGHTPSIFDISQAMPDPGANIKISKLKVKCTNVSCESVLDLGQLRDHLRVCECRSVACPFSRIGCDSKDQDKNNLVLHLASDNVKHSNLVVDSIESMGNEVTVVREESKQREAEIKQLMIDVNLKENIIISLEQQLTEIKRSIEEDKEKRLIEISSMKNMFLMILDCESVSNGDFLWKIEDMPKKMKVARKTTKTVWYSGSFFSHSGGYKFRLHVLPNGYGEGEGSYLCFGFQMLKSGNDSSLEWPFKGTIRMSILDQSTYEDVFVRCYNLASLPEDRRYLLDRPMHHMAQGWGDNKVVEINKLRNDKHLILRGVLIVKCSILQ